VPERRSQRPWPAGLPATVGTGCANREPSAATGRQLSAAPNRQMPQPTLRWRGSRQGRRLAFYQAQSCLGGPSCPSGRSAARPAPNSLSRQAPQPPHGRLLHGTGLAARRSTLERPPRLHPPVTGRTRPPRQRPHLRRRPPTTGRTDPLGDRTDRRRPAHRRPDRVGVRDHGLAGSGGQPAARHGGLGADLRPHLGRPGQASGRSPRGAEPPSPGGGAERRRVGRPVYQRGPALPPGLSPAGRAHHRAGCRGGDRPGLRPGPRRDAP
jgi:hypothetical protein